MSIHMNRQQRQRHKWGPILGFGQTLGLVLILEIGLVLALKQCLGQEYFEGYDWF